MKFKRILSAALATVMASSVMSVGMISSVSAAENNFGTYDETGNTKIWTFNVPTEGITESKNVNDGDSVNGIIISKALSGGTNKYKLTKPDSWNLSIFNGAIMQIPVTANSTGTLTITTTGKDESRTLEFTNDATKSFKLTGTDETPVKFTAEDSATGYLSLTPKSSKDGDSAEYKIGIIKVEIDGDAPAPPEGDGTIEIAKTENEDYVFVGVSDPTKFENIKIQEDKASEDGDNYSDVANGTITEVYKEVQGATNPLKTNTAYFFAFAVDEAKVQCNIKAVANDGTSSDVIQIGSDPATDVPSESTTATPSESTTTPTPEENTESTTEWPEGPLKAGPYDFSASSGLADAYTASGDNTDTRGTFKYGPFKFNGIRGVDSNEGLKLRGVDSSIEFSVADTASTITVSLNSKSNPVILSGTGITDTTITKDENNGTLITVQPGGSYKIAGTDAGNSDILSIAIG